MYPHFPAPDTSLSIPQLCEACEEDLSPSVGEFRSVLGVLTDVLNGSGGSDGEDETDDEGESRVTFRIGN